MAINFLRTKYNRTFDDLTRINYSNEENGTITAYVPFSASSFDDEQSYAEVDRYGSQWCKIVGIQQYGANDDIYLLKLKIDGYSIYDDVQSCGRTASITGTIGTKNKKMSFPFTFKITQPSCGSSGKSVGDMILWKLSGGDDIFSRIETEDRWRGNSYGARIIRHNDIVWSKLCITKCVDLSGFYSGQNLLEEVIIDNCDFSKVTTFRDMFYSCKNLSSIDLSEWNFSGAKNIESMFSSCSSITSVTFSGQSLSNCENMGSVFMNCTSLTEVNFSGVDTKRVTVMDNMFSNCNSLQDVDVSNFSTFRCVSMANMFNGCSSLKTLDIRGWDVSSCTNFYGIFKGCRSLKNIIGGADTVYGSVAMSGGKSSLDISDTNLDLPSVVAIFLGVSDVGENSNVTMTINARQMEMAEDYLSIIRAKNWEIEVV